MGNAISDSRKFRRGVDATLSEPTAEGVDRVLHLLGQHPHQMIYKDRESWSIFVKLAQAGSIEGLRFALSLARDAVYATAPSDQLQMRILRARLKGIFNTPLTQTSLACLLLTHRAEGAARHVHSLAGLAAPKKPQTTPLLAAAEHGHLNVLRWMVEQGVNVCTTDPVNGFNVLHATCKGDEPDLLRELLQWDLPVPTPDGLVPLHSSEHDPAGDGRRCKWADFAARGNVTPLMVACYYKHNECVRVLLEHGADLHIEMTFCSGLPMPAGSSALHCAARTNNMRAAIILLQELVNRMARVSPASGGDVRTRAGWEGDRALDLRIVPNSIAATPLSYALYVVRDDLLCILLDPTRPVAGAIAALDPTWEPTVVGVPRLRTLALEALRASLLDSIDAIEAASAAPPVAESPAIEAVVRSSLEAPRSFKRARIQQGPQFAAASCSAPANSLCVQRSALPHAASSSSASSSASQQSGPVNTLAPPRSRTPAAIVGGARAFLSNVLLREPALQANGDAHAAAVQPVLLRSFASARSAATMEEMALPHEREGALNLARWSTGQNSLQQSSSSSELRVESATVHAGPQGFFARSGAAPPHLLECEGLHLAEVKLSLGDLGRPVVAGNAAMYEAMMHSAGLDAASHKRCSLSLGSDAAADDEDAALHARLLFTRQASVRHAAGLSQVSNSTLPVGDERLCPVCISAEVQVEVAACKHAVCCECARMLCSLPASTPQCPLCRATIGAFQPSSRAVGAQ